MAASTPESRLGGASTPCAAAPRRDRLREAGREFDTLLREEITDMAHECERLPEPTMMFKDVAPQRARAASVVTVGACIQALADSDSLSDKRLEQFIVRVSAWVHSLRRTGTDSLSEAWSRETRLQATADIAQAHALYAIERRDLPALDQAIDDTAAHVASQQALLAQLKQAKRLVLSQSLARTAPRVRILSGVGQPS